MAMCATNTEVDALEVRHPALYTVDRASGTLGRPIEVDGPAVPTGVADGRLVLLQERREGPAMVGYRGVARVDPRSRKVTYSPLARTYEGTPGMVGGALYVSGQTGLVTAFDPATGRKKWSRQTNVEGASGPVAGGRRAVLQLGHRPGGRAVTVRRQSPVVDGPAGRRPHGRIGRRPAGDRRGAGAGRRRGQEHPLRLRRAAPAEVGLTPRAFRPPARRHPVR